MNKLTRTAAAVAAILGCAIVFASVAVASDSHGKHREHHLVRHNVLHHFGVLSASGTATLELRKTVVPGSDSGRFNLIARYLAGALISRTVNAGNGSTSGRFAIPAGRLLNIEETAGANTSLSNYSSQIACMVVSGPDTGMVLSVVSGHAERLTAKPGDGYTCTFTNTRTTS
jgi:hypothetical protein